MLRVLPHQSMDEAERVDMFDIQQVKHKGQFALRKLYHESDRLLAVLYTAPTCGPCRWEARGFRVHGGHVRPLQVGHRRV